METMFAHNAGMAKKRPAKGGKGGDRHKPGRIARIKERLAMAAEPLIERNETNLTQEVNRALREMLEREGFWPPKAVPPQDEVED